MSSSAARIGDYLGPIVQAIDRINSYIADKTEEQFSGDLLVQDAVIRNLEVIGEASRNILRADLEYSVAHPELALTSAYEMRNVLAHGYMKVDIGIVWKTVLTELPPLLIAAEKLRNQ